MTSVRGEQDGQTGYAHQINGEWRFIPDDPANAPGVGPRHPMNILPNQVTDTLKALTIGLGETIENTGLRAQVAQETFAGLEGTEAQQELAEVRRLLAPLEDTNPLAVGIGQSLPGFLLPSSKAIQTAGGVAEGILASPENPYLGGIVGGTGAFLGGIAGEKLGQAILSRGTGAVARLSERGIPTTLAQRTGSNTEKGIEAGLQAMPVLSHWAQAPARAQQRALNRGAQSVFGYEGTLTPKGLGEIKAGISKSFQEVQSAIPDQQLDSVLVDRLDELGALDDATKEFMQGYGIADGEALMGIRSNLNEDMAGAFINGNMKEGRQLRAALNEVDTLIKTSLPTDMVQQWSTARQQWQFLTAIRKGKAISGDGNVNLTSMNSALNSIYPNFRVGKDLPGAAQGFGELVQALDELPKALQTSGTAERAAFADAMNKPIESATGSAIGLLPAARAVGQPGVDAGATLGVAGATTALDAIDDTE